MFVIIKNNLLKRSVFSGLLIFTISSTLLLCNLGWIILWFLTLAGFIYGLCVSPALKNVKSSGIFLLISTVSYLFVFVLTIYDFQITSLKIILFSVLGSVILTTAHYFNSIIKPLFVRQMILSIFCGVVSAIPSSICYYIVDQRIFNQIHFLGAIISIGVFSIYPIWQIIFSMLILSTNNDRS